MTTQEDILEAKRIYDEIIFTQSLNPSEVKRAFKLLFGYDAVNANQAKMQVSSYFMHVYQKTDSTDSNAPVDTTDQSHSEDFTQPITDSDIEELRFLNNMDNSDGFIDVPARIEDVKERIDKRSKEYKQSLNKE